MNPQKSPNTFFTTRRKSVSNLIVAESRSRVASAQRIVVKAGTAVVSNSDGYPSLTRMGAIVEQISWLRKIGKEVLFVSSGAVGVGRQVLKKQQLLKSSLGEVLKGQNSFGNTIWEKNSYNAACAAAGQLGLMSLYDSLFQSCETATSQMLVTEFDFRTPERRKNLRYTMGTMVSMGMVPIINENDAVSGNEGYTKNGQFSDNDGLAALVAEVMGAQLLILLTDVDGVYNKAPSIPGAKVIHTYLPSFQVEIGEKSEGGRGGMSAKISAATKAVNSGVTSVVIANGHNPFSIEQVCSGEKIGTLFCINPEEMENLDTPSIEKTSEELISKAEGAKLGGRQLCDLTSQQRSKMIDHIADCIASREKEILEANKNDLEEAEKVNLAAPLMNRLKLTPSKIKTLVEGMKSLANQDEPIGKCIKRMEVAEGLELKQITAPIGVLLVIFESRPDSLPQIAALALRSGNGLLLKGGKEAVNSNICLHRIITDAIEESSDGKVSKDVIGLIFGRESANELLKLDHLIDLVIPRGSGELVNKIKSNTKIPVLGHSEGICHVYIDRSADLAKAVSVSVDSKTNYPAACNAAETLLIHSEWSKAYTLKVLDELREKNVNLFGGPRAIEMGLLSIPTPGFKTEYGDDSISVEVVDDMEEVIEHIHKYGSGHTETIVAEDEAVARSFMQRVDSACVFHNASTRFSDGFRFGLGAEVGISTGRIHSRGPVGVEGLLTTKWLLKSKDVHTVEAMGSNGGKKYTHIPMTLEDGV
mmetsp:Transcript_14206/g.20995  ORF Transcript_14206/g.20995 Transcript_14206/m.20995 type:complete len:759 (-) Transcript_14206:44-2320(-)|eukprot:CAMPEP_0171460128 /NCGR_PEP_ID=MMETSP0945-20130129/5122_1 /TAXON_ID=109269 /ORGANISM="Vaucheria litorea, Strain CCMP2940" /LENGTH=758 /DNA_ID=CAMNT_0011986257 /DNA_START=90 /DNA_END=2366 /DNA_ORIENTATION=-